MVEIKPFAIRADHHQVKIIAVIPGKDDLHAPAARPFAPGAIRIFLTRCGRRWHHAGRFWRPWAGRRFWRWACGAPIPKPQHFARDISPERRFACLRGAQFIQQFRIAWLNHALRQRGLEPAKGVAPQQQQQQQQ